MKYVDEFFATARERYQIKLNRDSGMAWPWTHDPIFQTWRFCNVHREDDKTTAWFRENVRNKTVGYDNVAATIIFRWFNRIETGEKILDLLTGQWDTEEARRRLQDVKPVVTGAYIIKGADGFTKLDGVLHVIDIALNRLQTTVQPWDVYNNPTPDLSLHGAWNYLRQFYYLGDFMAYEVVSDLRWSILTEAPDILTWANPGPGAARGMGVVVDNDKRMFNRGSEKDRQVILENMRELLACSTDPNYWPAEWPQWEMREVEHWLCEFDKYQRVVKGERMKRRFQP